MRRIGQRGLSRHLHAQTARQLRAAAMTVGEERAPGLGRELLLEVRRVVSLLCDTPLIGHPLDEHSRRIPLMRFPFAIIYRIEGDSLRVLSIARRRQGPGFWSGRQ